MLKGERRKVKGFLMLDVGLTSLRASPFTISDLFSKIKIDNVHWLITYPHLGHNPKAVIQQV